MPLLRNVLPPPSPNLSPDMAEDEVTPEQLAAIAAENEEPEPVNYKPPAQKTVKEIHELDKDDESLRKYKEALLGSGVTESGNAVCVWMCVWDRERLTLSGIGAWIQIHLSVQPILCLANKLGSLMKWHTLDFDISTAFNVLYNLINQSVTDWFGENQIAVFWTLAL